MFRAFQKLLNPEPERSEGEGGMPSQGRREETLSCLLLRGRGGHCFAEKYICTSSIIFSGTVGAKCTIHWKYGVKYIWTGSIKIYIIQVGSDCDGVGDDWWEWRGKQEAVHEGGDKDWSKLSATNMTSGKMWLKQISSGRDYEEEKVWLSLIAIVICVFKISMMGALAVVLRHLQRIKKCCRLYTGKWMTATTKC